MKIAIISPGLLPVPSSDGGAVEQLIDTFLSQAQNSNKLDEYTVFSVSSHIKQTKCWRDKKVCYIQIAKKKVPIWSEGKLGRKVYFKIKYHDYLKTVALYLKSEKFDCVIIENRPQFVSFISKITDRPIYLHLHNEDIIVNASKYRDVPNKCKKIISVSHYIQGRISDTFGCENLVVLHNGIKVEQFRKQTNENVKFTIRKSYGINQEAFTICYTGRFTKEKGVLELVRAYEKLNVVNNLELVIIGSSWFGGNATSDYIEEVKKVAVCCSNPILFTGYIDNSKVAEIESVVDLAVIPSMWDDPLPLAVIEAMASELPIITTKSGGIPEMCTDETGIVLERTGDISLKLAEAILMFINEPKLCKNYGMKARKRACELFTTHDYYENFIKILEILDPR